MLLNKFSDLGKKIYLFSETSNFSALSGDLRQNKNRIFTFNTEAGEIEVILGKHSLTLKKLLVMKKEKSKF